MDINKIYHDKYEVTFEVNEINPYCQRIAEIYINRNGRDAFIGGYVSHRGIIRLPAFIINIKQNRTGNTRSPTITAITAFKGENSQAGCREVYNGGWNTESEQRLAILSIANAFGAFKCILRAMKTEASGWIKVVSMDGFSDVFNGGPGEYDASNHSAALAAMKAVIPVQLQQGHSIIIDWTNLDRRDREFYLKMARRYNTKIMAVWFDIPSIICIDRDASRPFPVGDDIINHRIKELQPPTKEEGFHKIIRAGHTEYDISDETEYDISDETEYDISDETEYDLCNILIDSDELIIFINNFISIEGQIIIVLVGAPGSGKTSLVRKIMEKINEY